MALQRDVKYSGRYDAATSTQPQGAFKNRTSPTSEDGSYMEKDWLNDWSGYMSSLLEANGITPNGLVDEVGASQYFQGMLQLRLVEPLNNDWNGFFNPNHQTQLPSPAGYPATSSAGGTVYGADDEWSLGNYSSGAANTISADDNGVIFSVGTYKLFTFTSEQLALIDETKLPVYIVDETGKRHFVNDGTTGVNVSKIGLNIKVELTNAIFSELGISKVWEFFVTEGIGYVPKLGVEALYAKLGIRIYYDETLNRTNGVTYTNPTDYELDLQIQVTTPSGTAGSTDIVVNGKTVRSQQSRNDSYSHIYTETVSIPPRGSYSINLDVTIVISKWFELRIPK